MEIGRANVVATVLVDMTTARIALGPLTGGDRVCLFLHLAAVQPTTSTVMSSGMFHVMADVELEGLSIVQDTQFLVVIVGYRHHLPPAVVESPHAHGNILSPSGTVTPLQMATPANTGVAMVLRIDVVSGMVVVGRHRR